MRAAASHVRRVRPGLRAAAIRAFSADMKGASQKSEPPRQGSAGGGGGSSLPLLFGVVAGAGGGFYGYAQYTGQDVMDILKNPFGTPAPSTGVVVTPSAPAVKTTPVPVPAPVPVTDKKTAAPAAEVKNEAPVNKELAPAAKKEVPVAASAPAPVPAPTPAPTPTPTPAPASPVASNKSSSYSVLPPVPSESRALQPSGVSTATMSEMAKQSAALREELDATLLKDLHTLDANALRTRVAQLAAEFFERTKWEGVRLHQALRLVEAEVSKRYIDLLAQQRAELEVEANKQLHARENELFAEASRRSQDVILKQEESSNRTLRAQAEGFKSVLDDALKKQEAQIRAELTEEMNHSLALVREGHVQQMLKVQQDMASLQADIAAFHAAADALSNNKARTVNLHKHAAAVLNLESALRTSAPLSSALNAVRDASNGDALVLALLDSIPATAARSGLPTLPELKARFAVVRGEVRKVALQPEGLPAVIGSVVGSGLANLYWAPTGPVKGDGVEEILARAAHELELGRLPEALNEIKDIRQPDMQALMKDWLELAKARLASDQAAVALRSHAIVKFSAVSEV